MNNEYFKKVMGRIRLNDPHICNVESTPGLIVQTLSMGNGEKKIILDIEGSHTSPRTLHVPQL